MSGSEAMGSMGGCPRCGHNKVKTIDSRPADIPDVLRRRRKECAKCDYTFTTHEVVIGEHGVGAEKQAVSAIRFLAEVEASARRHFGDAKGRMYTRPES